MVIHLPNGGVVQIESTTISGDVAAWSRATTATIIIDGWALNLRLPRRERLVATAEAAGERLSAEPIPLIMLAILAVISLQNRLPDLWQISLLRSVLHILPSLSRDASPPRPLRELRLQARSLLRQSSQESLAALQGNSWDVARLLCLFGEELWSLRGADAARWGTLPIYIRPEIPPIRALLALGGVMAVTGMPRGQVSLPLAPGGSPVFGIVDWLALASGPHPPPVDLLDDGLGQVSDDLLALGTTDEGLALTQDQADRLYDLAAILLAQVSNPTPRCLNRALDVDLPPDLMPPLAVWGVQRMRVIPHPSGLWIAVGDETFRYAAAAWWFAQPESGLRYPISFPPAAWMLVHPILAALWHDLCADAVIIERAESSAPLASSSPRVHRSRERPRSIVRLPPNRYIGRWASSEDRALITRYVLAGHGYRRLPAGWREREQRPDVQRRRAAAAARARAHGLDAPPPGYTYVSPHQRSVASVSSLPHAESDTSAPPRVRARGLFTLMLGLRRDHAEDAEDAEE